MTAVFKKIYKATGSQYWNQFNSTVSSFLLDATRNRKKENAFDFDNGTHWTPSEDSKSFQWIKFCFNNFVVNVEKYEMMASNGNCRPNSWTFSGSMDDNFVNAEAAAFSFPKLETKSFTWKHGPYRCFKITSTSLSQCDNYLFDINQIELYGTIIKLHNSNQNACKCRHSSPNTIILILFLIS